MKIKSLMTSIAVCLIMMTSAWAAETSAEQNKINQMSSDTQQMKAEIAELRHELAALKHQQKKSRKKSKSHAVKKPVPAIPDTTVTPDVASVPQEMQGTDMDRLIQAYLANLPVDWDNPGKSFVSIGPYVNIPVQFSGDNLIINDPKINTDVALLKLRKAAHEGMVKRGIHTEEDTHHSHLILSGNLEGVAQYIQYGKQNGVGSAGNNGSSSNFNLSNAEIDAYLLTPSPWVSAFMSIAYDDSLDKTISNSKVMNSRLYLNNGFIIIGDFLRSPLYATLGQMYVPFGTYSSVFVSTPLTKRLGRTKVRAVLMGYQQQTENAFYTALYAFQGDSHGSATSRINNGGINLGYRFYIASMEMGGDFGAGWIGNIADSVGMQDTGNQPMFNGFGGPTPFGNEKIVHRVPALDLRGKLSIRDSLDFIAEYVGVTTAFNPNDLSFQTHGARPWAVNAEAAYTFKILSKPTSIGVGYSQAIEALALGMPAKRYGMVLNTSIWHNTLQSIEVRHDINYSQSKTATGSGVLPLTTGLGIYDNVVTLEFDVYF